MIEVDSCYPSDWNSWNSSSSQPYLELYGETQPVLCTNLTEMLPASATSDDLKMDAVLPIYEYFWTIGISEHLYDQFAQHVENVVDEGVDVLTHHHTGAEVTLYFPLAGGWRVEEVVATIKYVRPLPHQDNLVKKVADYWDTVAPIVGKIADITGKLNIPGVSIGANLLSMLTKVPITSLPPVDGLSWSIKRVTGYIESEIMDGVRWTLPKKLFYILGYRVTGSIAVYFHPTQHRPHHQNQQQEAVSGDQPKIQTKPILAQAVVSNASQRIPTLGKEYSKLDVTPGLLAGRVNKQEAEANH